MVVNGGIEHLQVLANWFGEGLMLTAVLVSNLVPLLSRS